MGNGEYGILKRLTSITSNTDWRGYVVVSQNCDRTAQEIRKAVIEDVRRPIGVQKVCDDITLVVVKQK